MVDYIPILIGVVTFVVLRKLLRSRETNLPPGPLRLPVIGTIYKHGLHITAEKLAAMAKVYGDVFCVYFGPKRVLVLNSHESIREAMTKPYDFAHRGFSDKYSWKMLNPNSKGIIACDYDERLIRTRNLAISIMRFLGVGKTVMEEKILHEANDLSAIFSSTNCNEFDPKESIATAVVNVMLHIVLNKRFEHGDKSLLKTVENTETYMALMVHATFVDRMPILRFLPHFRRVLQRFVACNSEMREFMWSHAKEIMDHLDLTQSSNFVECYAEKHYNKEKQSVELDEENLRYTLVDMLLGGAETSATSIRWTVLCLANRPEIQEKLHKEIRDVIGLEREIVPNDRDSLPYLRAVIWEVQRFYNLGHIVPHMSNLHRDAVLQGFNIPKGTMIILNHLSVHMDERNWGDPRTFRPERFLDENGEFVNNPKLVPFSVGQRSCPGELLAKQELFIFTAALFQKFKFCKVEGQSWIDEAPATLVGLTLSPKAFKIKALPR